MNLLKLTLVDVAAYTCPICGYDMDLYETKKGKEILSCCNCEYQFNLDDLGDYFCVVCHKWFNYDPNHEPHSLDGEDCHEQCCPDCNDKQAHRGHSPDEYCAKCGGTCQYDSDGKLLAKAP